MICDTERSSEGSAMYIEIDFNSDEALYVQLCNQIILGIATSRFREGEQLPSVRQLADTIGINMHTVNKAYSILQQEGFVKIDRRRGAIIAVDINKLQALQEAEGDLAVVVARAICKDISRQDIHELVDKIYDYYEKGNHS
jgi:DNA-binding transcriptional regulator YhcF (GntR family)